MNISFLSPLRLLLLAVPLALVAAYVVMQLRRPRYALRFATVETLRSVAPRRPGWRRHLPAIAVVFALVLSTLAFARPARAEEIAVEQGTVILAVDRSYSMAAEDVAPTRLDAALDALRVFIADVPDGIEIGLVTFAGDARLDVAPTPDRQAVLDALERIELAPRTATGDAIFSSLDALAAADGTGSGGGDGSGPADDGSGRYIVLLADGGTTVGRSDQEASAAAAEEGVPVTTIAFGTDQGTVVIDGQLYPAPADPESLAAIADETGGRAYTAETADELAEVYGEIGTAVATEERKVEVTAWFSGAALAAAALAALAGLVVWNDRML